MHTTSRRDPSKGRTSSTAHINPIKGIRLTITVSGLGKVETEQLRRQGGLSLKQVGRKLSITIAASTPEEALERISAVGVLLSPKR